MNTNRLVLVDYLKGISIAAIAVYHLLTVFWGITGPIALAASFAGAGIHLFNVCSGFGLALSHIKKPLKPLEFFKQRFLKIYIPYAIAMTVSLAFTPFMLQSTDPIGDYLSHIFLYKMFMPKGINSYGGQFWYISTIFQFYFLFPVLMRVWKTLGSRKFFLLSLGISLLWMAMGQVLGWGDLRPLSNCAIQYLWEFALGICLADRYITRGNVTEKRIPLWLIGAISMVCLGIYGLTSLKGGILQGFNDFFAGPAIFGIYYVLYHIPVFRRVFAWVSQFSFAWYLTHFLVFNGVFQLLPFSDIPSTIISLPVSILFAWAFQRLTDRLTAPKRTA